MPFISDCAQGGKNGPLCFAIARSPLSVMVPEGNFITLAGMFQMAQCCPSGLVSPSVVSMNVIANDIVPLGAPDQSSSGLGALPALGCIGVADAHVNFAAM